MRADGPRAGRRGLRQRPPHRLGRPLQARTERTRRDRGAHRSAFTLAHRDPHARDERLPVDAPARRVALGARHRGAGPRDSYRADRARHAGAPVLSWHRRPSTIPADRSGRSSPGPARRAAGLAAAFAKHREQSSAAPYFDAATVTPASRVDGIHPRRRPAPDLGARARRRRASAPR